MKNVNFSTPQNRDGPWPNPTQAYFWPALNKMPTRLWAEGQKIEKFDVFRGNFPNSNPNHKWLTRPEPQKIDPTRPGSKILDPDPSLSQKQPCNKL